MNGYFGYWSEVLIGRRTRRVARSGPIQGQVRSCHRTLTDAADDGGPPDEVADGLTAAGRVGLEGGLVVDHAAASPTTAAAAACSRAGAAVWEHTAAA